MIPHNIEQYLQDRGVRYRTAAHAYRATAQETAAVSHISGRRFAKTVVLKRQADGRFVIALVPASEWVDLDELSEVIGTDVDLADERDFAGLFPDCEPGAMPPLGGLYGLPVYADACLAREGTVAVNGGTHTDVIELAWDAFVAAEHPRLIEH
jgi:Ala-tRNA(Pro) deacylase